MELFICLISLRSIFKNAAAAFNRNIIIREQIYPAKNERSCADVFCEVMGENDCHRAKLVSSRIDAVNATVVY